MAANEDGTLKMLGQTAKSKSPEEVANNCEFNRFFINIQKSLTQLSP
jgi:hypothetical protein